ncbi:LysM peptidoglycan-binding domain-containing protein [Rhizobium ruizarguesonis]|jgi:nucleoid-associated protein YgaU|uniref:LysM peptidoglycan-binding domain-containing protein n=1 Tax=Rhizobium ruizarguesonis TaxID=2081791 RepID=UPI000364BC30|nr:LysM peptidoglycan-binding domain-containing protein [Rhizobium ruizarguesonis]MBY5831663.1 LysM peptidoglycan-binding domain-containing protein [Rhizobium leguminosarum]QJS26938.1 LysM peptidoglycan-binding domain-containing protein [Rhizobium leguminosarum bv. trifolii TA1]TBY91562.1 LysM peptidoglycan-binding domain-containing protein [Rhizobium leguminosarum bv. viciae]MBY5860356.1 LysM peptidoglycan-binding domain-containing protein [Rhizobium leguminosarum]MBY5872692.1 LysM peptidogly
MMKNRAGLLALAVLAIAILLMVFVVMPRIGGDATKVGDAINQASTELKNTVNEASKTSRSAVGDAAAVADQVGRLSADAGVSLSELKALFADGKGPAIDVFTAAKTKAVNALTALAGFTIPEGLDPATQTLAAKAKDGGAKALAIVQSLPENIADALAAIAKAEAALTGAPETAPAANTAAENTGPKLPAFDVLRVEPDGSTVIAGSAEPNGKLEVLDGEKVVTTANVDASGDFAAVLDDPLPAGDHQLVLKFTGKDGKSTLSEEVATISVPKDGNGANLLAMVSKPGAASRIITAPKAGTEVADASNPMAPPADKPATGESSAAPAATVAPTGELALQAPNLTDTSSAGAATPSDKANVPDVMVNAVEIEGNKIFIAGTTRPNAKVIGYADDSLVGQDTAGSDGHFVIDGVVALSVGDHKIRVDVVDPAGKVIVRAAVNFNRPAGDQVRVAAQSVPADTNSAPSMVPLDEGELDKLKAEVGKAFGLLKGLFADGKLPGAEQLAAARSATEFALRSVADFRPAADAPDVFKQTSGSASQIAGNALKLLQGLPKDAKSVGSALDRLGAMIAELAVAPAPAAPSANDVGSNQPKTIEQAPLTANNAAVIIRRGDTLWQISRRTYGLGVRYTTIYIANEDKIINPDRIRPGQIFGLPKDVLPNAEELHRKRMSGQHL